jgi:hypothetical protein
MITLNIYIDSHLFNRRRTNIERCKTAMCKHTKGKNDYIDEPIYHPTAWRCVYVPSECFLSGGSVSKVPFTLEAALTCAALHCTALHVAYRPALRCT